MSDQPEAPRRKIGPYERSLLESRAAIREAERRAARQRLRRLRAAAALTVVLLVATTVGTVVWWLGRPDAGTPAASPAAQQRCQTSAPVRIWAPPSAGPALQAAVKAYGEQSGATCADFTVEAHPSADVAERLSGGEGERPDAWVTDSAVWADKVTSAKKVALEPAQPFATSPLVLAVSRQSASTVPAGTSWKALLASGQPVRLSDPRTTTAGMLALASALPVLGSDARAALPHLAKGVAPSTEDLFATDKGSSTAAIFPAAEVDVIAHNLAATTRPFAAVVPGERTASFEYSLVSVATEPAKVAAIRDLRTFLSSGAAVQALAGSGLRPTVDTRAVPAGPGAVTATFTAAAPTLQAVTTAGNAWQAATLDFRLLAVIDVSGSMKERAGASTRIGITQQAAQLALGSLPRSSELGLWAFSIGIGPAGADYKQLAPIGPLSDEQHLARVSQATASLSRRVGGGTGLYDTIWAAYQEVLDGWKPGQVNAVVILTDGRNDDPRGLSLAQLTARLAKADPKRPVAITTIGIGPDVDAKALTQISTMMHSAYYPAPRPEDMQQVLATALLDHDCTDGVCA